VTKNVRPQWRDAPCGGQYQPSTNVPPTAYTPIIFKDKTASVPEDLIVQPMMWGLVPPWHHGLVASSHKLTTNNARIEGLSESKLYKPAIEQNRRCVVICDGFYEWKKIKSGEKQPYLVYANQHLAGSDDDDENKGLEMFAKAGLQDHWSESKEVHEGGHRWNGPRPLFMAGLYSIWYSEQDRDDRRNPVYSYAVITRESNKALDWLHERMPAILSDEKAVSAWLDPEIKGLDALKVLQPVEKNEIEWYPVSKSVGSVKNQESSLCKRVALDSNTGKAMTKSDQMAKSFMANWLSQGTSTKRKADQEQETEVQEEKPDVKKDAKNRQNEENDAKKTKTE